jgi:hypothetical protein
VIPGADQRARELITFADAVEDMGLEELARRSRLVASDLLEALNELDAERSASRALRERCEEQQAILGRQADQALREALVRERRP